MRLVFLGVLFIVFQSALAQNLEDVARFSQQEIMGSARYVSMAGAFGSLGGELSAVNTNPAGLGVFRRGQFSSSITVGNNSSTIEHYGTNSESDRTFGRLSNFSVVLAEESDHPDWEFVNMYFGYNQQRVFTSNTRFSGVNNQSSLLDLYFLDVIEDPDVTVESIESFFPFGAGLAWGAFLIDTLNGEYYHANEFHGQTQTRADSEERGIGHYSFGLGGNFRNKLYLGATIGFSALRYASNSVYREVLPENDPNTFVKDWQQENNLTIRGNGFQFKLGAIYRINKYLRMGASFRSTEYFKLSEVYTSDLTANWKDRDPTSANSPESLNDYKFRSPYILGLSFGAAKKKLGAINIGAELVGNEVIEFRTIPFRGIDFTEINQEIENVFKPTFNARVGVEKVFGPISMRAGYAFRSAVTNSTLAERQFFGFGGGYRIKKMMFDIGYGYTMSNAVNRNIHFAENINLKPSTQKLQQHQVVVSVGVYLE